jgi:hypothetical protein
LDGQASAGTKEGVFLVRNACVDYHVWGERERVYRGRAEPFDTLEELEAAAQAAWTAIPQENICRSIDRFKMRLGLVVDNEGGPIQHLAR